MCFITKPDHDFSADHERCEVDKIFLSMRWNLIQSGIQRTLIKIAGSYYFYLINFMENDQYAVQQVSRYGDCLFSLTTHVTIAFSPSM